MLALDKNSTTTTTNVTITTTKPVISRISSDIQKNFNNISPSIFEMIDNPTLDETTMNSAINSFTKKQKLKEKDSIDDEETEQGKQRHAVAQRTYL